MYFYTSTITINGLLYKNNNQIHKSVAVAAAAAAKEPQKMYF
jgi:hypothetical protein